MKTPLQVSARNGKKEQTEADYTYSGFGERVVPLCFAKVYFSCYQRHGLDFSLLKARAVNARKNDRGAITNGARRNS